MNISDGELFEKNSKNMRFKAAKVCSEITLTLYFAMLLLHGYESVVRRSRNKFRVGLNEHQRRGTI